MRPFRMAGLFFAACFAILFMLRLDVFSRFSSARSIREAVDAGIDSRDSWMTIHQNDRRIGYSFSRLRSDGSGYDLEEKVRLRLTTMGMVHDLRLGTEARLHPDLTLDEFRFEIHSGRFRFAAEGKASERAVSVTTESVGDRRRIEVPMPRRFYPLAAVIHALGAAELKAGDRHVFDVFDLASISHVPVQAEVIGREEIELAEGRVLATRATLNFKGTIQTVWIGGQGELLRERGLLGMRLEKSSREEALRDPGQAASEEITDAAAVAVNRVIADPAGIPELRVRLGGIRPEVLQLSGGRQEFRDGVLTVRRESLADLPPAGQTPKKSPVEQAFLRHEPFIQSDHEKIQAAVKEILGQEPLSALAKAERLMQWVHRNIRKRPVLSLPDALSTLEHREGDCNEHAMLYAALARAAGLPARVEAGLVYLNGKFYYHAWNLVYVGRWVTADSAFGQLPADVTHLRLVTGSANQQLDLAGVIGRVTIEMVD
jgi:hypothetical protein